MKLTKKLEKEILHAYHDYWNAYLKGNIRIMSSWLHDDVQMIGSGQGEFFKNKKETIKYYKATADQVAGKADMRNRKITIFPSGNQILVSEECDFFVLMDSTWTFYGDGRISTLFIKTDKGWKIIQEHGSIPDARTSVGEQVNTNKLKAENIKLKEAVKRRTIELEDKNRELRIEAALERVRARTMAMQKSDELPETTYLLFQQLKELGETAAQVSLSIIKEEEGIAELSATVHGKTILQTHRVPLDESFVMKKAVKAWKAKKRSLVVRIEGKELKDYNKWRNRILKKKIVFPEKQWIVNIVFFSKGLLSFSSEKEISKETFQLLERVAAVFDLTYTRFLDLQKAEAQAREAEIELGLERVRAKAMSMQHSNELADLVAVVFRELTHLGFPLTSSIIWIHDHASVVNTLWIASTEMNTPPQSYTINPFYNDFFRSIIHAWKARDPQWIFTLDGKRKKEFEKAFFKELPELPLAFKKALMQPKQVVFSASFNNFGALEIVATEPLNEEKFDILHRFGRVFDLSYTRFNDLQKAEAQAREAQIQLALERVRSRAMAMQSSDEVNALIGTVFSELTKLDLVLTRCIIWVFEPTTNAARWWMANSEVPSNPMSFFIKYHDHPAYLRFVQEWKNQNVKFIYDLKGKDKKNWDKILFNETELKNLPEVVKDGMQKPERVLLSASFNNFGGINVASLEPLSEEHFDILLRFAKVFDLTYTRFLDLKKAEAQAREAQIQLALERVRARTMAMHKSDELSDVSALLYKELQGLGVTRFINCGYVEINEADNIQNAWMTVADGSAVNAVQLPLTGDKVFDKRYDAWKRKEKIFHQSVGGDLLKSHIEFGTQHYRETEIDEMVRTHFTDPTIFYCSNFSHGYLHIVTDTLLSDEGESLLSRFTSVFEMTYKRFLDLQKAEAQAREAQIQLAMERVRARTMAMQRSDELAEAASLLFTQITDLGTTSWSSGFIIFQPDELSINSWMSKPDGSMGVPFNIPVTEDPFFIKIYEAYKRGEEFFVMESSGKELEETYKYMFSLPGAAKALGAIEDLGFQMPTFQITHCVFFPTGFLMFITYQPCQEMWEIFKRFGKVFEQTYTRFLDLQKAEAQAREAEIELGLERVRARAMAMQRSDEVKELIATMSIELGKLDIVLDRCFIIIYDPQTLGSTWWMSNPETPTEPIGLPVQYHEHVPYLEHLEAWRQRKVKWEYILEGKVKKTWDQFLFVETGLSQLPPPVIENMRSKKKVYLSSSFNNFGYLTLATLDPLTDQQFDIMLRFAKVFDLTYTRFLDIQKAEAQAREAQIELALERVRARTMAMQKSEELQEVVHTVFERLKELNVDFYTTIIILFQEGSRDIVWWLENTEERYSKVRVPYADITYLQNLWDAKDNERELSSFYYSFEEKNELFQYLFAHTDLKNVPEQQKKFLLNNQFIRISVALAKNTGIHISSYSRPSFSDKDHDILRRFAKVFDQAYTRFLDLQKAEAQAREAQIELSLERVRARAMAMHNSKELDSVIKTVYAELKQLDVSFYRCFIMIFDEKKGATWWMGSPDDDLFHDGFYVQYHTQPPHLAYLQGWEERQQKWEYWLGGQIKKDWDEFIFHETELSKLPPMVIQDMKSFDHAYLAASFENFGCMTIGGDQQLREESYNILSRFAKVFDLCYTRFLDLQKAEAQAREAQIEASLERVRSSAMAMHNSHDISSTTTIAFEELQKLNIRSKRCGVALLSKNSYTGNIYAAATSADGKFHTLQRSIDMKLHPSLKQQYESWKKQENYVVEMKGEELRTYYRLPFFYSSPDYVPPTNYDRSEYGYYIPFSEGLFYAWTQEPYSDEEINILNRFKKIVDLTFRRFFDLQKAEAQAREAKIEAALEKVRSRTMGMQHSNELPEAANLLFLEVQALGIPAWSCGYNILAEDKKSSTCIMSSEGQLQSAFHLPFANSGEPSFAEWLEAIEKQEPFFVQELSGKKIEDHYNYMKTLPQVGPVIKELEDAGLSLPTYQINHLSFFNGGFLLFITYKPVPDAHDLFKRFTKVFEQTYTRFLDLKNAEAQARESQIEASLERVRSRTMAMHNSNDLLQVINILSEQLQLLGFNAEAVSFITDGNEEGYNMWLSVPGDSFLHKIYVPRINDKTTRLYNEAKEQKSDFYSYTLTKEEKDFYFKNFFENTVLKNYPPEGRQAVYDAPGMATTNMILEKIVLSVSNFRAIPYTEPENIIIKRFAFVFQQSYIRFLDLQNAEAQAREAQIEASLERVRAKAMAMHSSEDLSETIAVFYRELKSLSVTPRRCGVALMDKESRLAELTTMNTTEEGDSIEVVGQIKMAGHPVLDGVFENWLVQKEYHAILRGNEIKEYYQVLKPQISYPDYPHDVVQYGYYFMFKEGDVYAWTESQLPEEHLKIYRRFASVISLTYKRYLDLKQAEANAREAQIEAALEKVRGKAMAMHNSNDLSITSSMIIGELRKLGISPIRCGVGILNKETHKAQLYTATSSADGDSLSVVGWVQLEGHRVLENIYQKWLDGEDYFPELSGDSMKAYYQQLLAGLSVPLPDFKDGQKHYGHFFSFSVGCLYAWADVKYSDDEIKILKRFASIIDLTFRRYFELQQSEANAKEAVKQAALDRIRADIASMRTVNDLNRITPLIWNELTILGLPFIRCGVFIMDDSQKFIHTFLSTPEGKAIAAFHLPYDTPGNFSEIVKHWHNKKIYTDHWKESDFISLSEILVKQGAIASKEQYLDTLPKGGFYLHFIPFLQGMLYVGNLTPLNETDIGLIESVADAFSTAYARYEDFNKLEAAKKQVDSTLTELQTTQKQLIQSEKMASLGELTAGIAHEIQNPLNFVNNFSEVSNELIEEMKDELEKGNKEDAVTIAEDVKQNLEKINFHGKRADAIVKSMLQHSRSSSGKKELTDINALCDEYLRLSYHGLRAKDKSFNAKFETDFDKTIEKINVVPQDIGRVVLNLINNAFYAVTEKKKSNINGYDPIVTVSTKKLKDKIEVKVKDNGNGIPQKVLDKIFQPFFTTKPTGQGTGLGLSLSYDIITKGHGGELKVETKEGEGSTFVIFLPVN